MLLRVQTRRAREKLRASSLLRQAPVVSKSNPQREPKYFPLSFRPGRDTRSLPAFMSLPALSSGILLNAVRVLLKSRLACTNKKQIL